MKALLIGKRAKILDKLSDVLTENNWEVARDNILDDRHLKNLDVSDVDVVAFGQALSQIQKRELADHYQAKNSRLKSIEGYGPIPDLLAYQIMSVHSSPQDFKVEGTTITALRNITLTISLYRLNWLYMTKTKTLSQTLPTNDVIDLVKVADGFQFAAVKSSGSQYATLKISLS